MASDKKTRKGATKHCCYGHCKSDSRKNTENLFYFLPFPKPCLQVRKHEFKTARTLSQHIGKCASCDKADRWVKLCHRRKNFRDIEDITKDTYICSLHFPYESGPTNTHPDPIRGANEKTSAFKRTSLDVKYGKMIESGVSTSLDNALFSEPMDIDAAEMEVDPEVTVVSPSVYPTCHEMSIQTVPIFYSDAATQTCDLLCSSEETDVQTEAPRHQWKSTQTTLSVFPHMQQLHKCRQKVRDMKKQLAHSHKNAMESFTEQIQSNSKKCVFYTGLYFQQIVALLTFLGPSVNNLHYWNTADAPNEKRKRARKFTPLGEITLVLMRLRRGFLITDLAYRFNVSTSQVSKLTITWVQLMFKQFSTLRPYMFPSRQKICETLPAIFRRLKNIRVLVDCTEFFCEAPSNFEHQGNLYSQYKAHTTFKVLIGCTPNGAISFVSDLYEGSISDRALFEQSKIVDLLDEGDLVLADRGFTVSDIVDEVGAHLNIPPFLKGRIRLTPQEEIETKRIAKERIYVEHVIGRLKGFRLLTRVLPLNMRGILNQLVFVCACLVNFQRPIVMD